MFKLAALPTLSARTSLSLLTATALFSVSSMSSAIPFLNKNLPTDHDAELSVGVNAMAVKSAYDLDDNTEFRVLPGVFYDNNRVYARGAQAGVYLINDGTNQFSLYAQPSGNSFDPDDASGNLAELDERKLSAAAGASYQRRTPIGAFRAQIATDVLDKSGGNTARLTYIGRITANKLTIYPSVGFEYFDEDYNNYYYGVTEAESAKSGVEPYASNNSLNPYINISANYDFNENWAGFANQSLSYLPNEQYDSPMVNSRTDATTTLGLLYKF